MERSRWWGRGFCCAFALLVSLLMLNYSRRFIISRVAWSNNDTDNYIYGLNYSVDQVLASKGDIIKTSVIKAEGNVKGNRDFIVITREKKTAYNRLSEIGVVASNEHRSFPGSLLLANQRLMDNTPDVLAVDRAPLTYTVNLPGLTTDGSFKIVPSFSEYQAGINKVLETWFNKYSDDHSVNANFYNDFSFAYSRELMRVIFGLEFKYSEVESHIDFTSMEKQEKLIIVHRFQQIFYTVSVEPTKKPSDLFGSEVTMQELKEKINKDNPPVIVDSVSYGRTIYVVIETSSTDKQAKLFLETRFQELNIKNEADIKRELKNLRLTVLVLGGSTDHIQLINAGTIKEVNDIIVKFSKFSRTNPGYPISYSSQFIKDNSRAVVQMANDYIDTTRTIYSKGTITIVHKGWFVMQWEVTWIELNYDGDGNSFTTKKQWAMNYQVLTAPFRSELELPGNARDIYVLARAAAGLFDWIWEPWRIVIEKGGIPMMTRMFTVWGTTLYPAYNISPPL